jgi:hypothetical protein
MALIIRAVEAPRTFAARTYSRSLSLYVAVLTYHVIPIQPKNIIIPREREKLGITIEAIIIIAYKKGILFHISIIR